MKNKLFAKRLKQLSREHKKLIKRKNKKIKPGNGIFEIDYQGKNYLAFGQDVSGNLYCFVGGKDEVYYLDHDYPEETVELGSFEELIKEQWR